MAAGRILTAVEIESLGETGVPGVLVVSASFLFYSHKQLGLLFMANERCMCGAQQDCVCNERLSTNSFKNNAVVTGSYGFGVSIPGGTTTPPPEQMVSHTQLDKSSRSSCRKCGVAEASSRLPAAQAGSVAYRRRSSYAESLGL